MLQIGYLTYCTMVSECYYHLLSFLLFYFNKQHFYEVLFVSFIHQVTVYGLPKYQAGQCEGK